MTYNIDTEIATALKVAHLYAQRSKAQRLRVGAVVFHCPSRTIISTGYNGTPPGACNQAEQNNVTLPTVVHAEINAITKIPWYLRFRLRRSVLVLTHSPCAACVRAIIASGIRAVYYETPYRDTECLQSLLDNNITVRRVSLMEDAYAVPL